jgi:hypothetical protein
MKSPLTSDRLQKPLAALRAAGKDGITPIELGAICNSTRPTSDLSELKQWGIPIEKTWLGYSPNRRRVYSYKLGGGEESVSEFDENRT